jgi:DNA primase large subunit
MVCSSYTVSNLRLLIYDIDEDYNNGTISERMVRSVEHYPVETIVLVHAKLRKAAQRVKNATIHDYELDVSEVHKISSLSEHVPFSVYDAENIHRENEDLEDDDEVDDTAVISENSSEQDTPRESKDLGRRSGANSKCE